ncbi:hypothetical protein [Croceimicrobium sp.]|uniref:hypothetical protein n=1 Tax=Croceimicrobium sp. TaxID=2828340 RepID=UPI003BA9365D
MSNYLIAFIPFILFYFLARIMMDRANRKLDAEKKAEMVDLFSNRSPLRYLWLAFLLGGLYAVWQAELLDLNYTLAFYFAGLIVYSVFYGRKSVGLLKANNFPPDYIRAYLSATLFQWAGIAFLVFGMILVRNG